MFALVPRFRACALKLGTFRTHTFTVEHSACLQFLRTHTYMRRKGTLQQRLHTLLIKAKVAEWRAAGGHFDDEAEREGKGQEGEEGEEGGEVKSREEEVEREKRERRAKRARRERRERRVRERRTRRARHRSPQAASWLQSPSTSPTTARAATPGTTAAASRMSWSLYHNQVHRRRDCPPPSM